MTLTRRGLLSISAGAAMALLTSPGSAQQYAPPAQGQGNLGQGNPDTFSPEEIVDSGHRFFGNTSRGLALSVQNAFSKWGSPNGYILGQEAAGSFFGGLRYGEGQLYTRSRGERRVFWQGPSLGFDFGGSGNRTMILAYHLPSVDMLYQRFAGVDGSAYLVAGFAMSALAGRGQNGQDIILVPIRTGVGLKLGVNIGYLKFTPEATWNPF